MKQSKKLDKIYSKRKTIKKLGNKQDINKNKQTYTVRTEKSEIEYTRIPVYGNIQNRLNKIFKKQVNAFVIAPTPEERRKLITQLIGQYAVRQLSITARFYYIQPVTYAITKKIYKQKIHDMGTTVGKAINAIQDFGYKVFIHGGTIRDIFINKDKSLILIIPLAILIIAIIKGISSSYLNSDDKSIT